MADIIDTEEIDRDTVEAEDLEKQFNKKYHLLTEIASSIKRYYINNIHGTKSLNVAVTLSDHSIKVFKINNVSLTQLCHLRGHNKPVTEVVFHPKEDHLLYSVGEDGVMKLWDTRSGGDCVQDYIMEDENDIRPYECMDVSSDGRVLCAGSQLKQQNAYLVFWDQRQPIPLGGYWECHNDDITQVKFHKQKTGVLATGSIDGLINIYNIMEQTEDDALTYSLNAMNAIEKISWLDEKHVMCTTQSNELQLWDTEKVEMLRSFDRDKVARAIRRSKGDDCYLVDTYITADDTPVLLAGSYGGKGDTLRSVSMVNKKLQPGSNFVENKQTVKCCWYEKDRDLLVTAGESGIISVWSGDMDNDVKNTATPTAQKITRSLNKLHVNRHKPY